MEKLKKLSRAEMKNVVGGDHPNDCKDQCILGNACPNPSQECTPFDDCHLDGGSGTVIQFRCA